MTLRERLQELERERGDLHETRVDLERRIGDALFEVRQRGEALPTGAAAHLTLTEAAQLLGMSRPSAYRLLEQAERRKS